MEVNIVFLHYPVNPSPRRPKGRRLSLPAAGRGGHPAMTNCIEKKSNAKDFYLAHPQFLWLADDWKTTRPGRAALRGFISRTALTIGHIASKPNRTPSLDKTGYFTLLKHRPYEASKRGWARGQRASIQTTSGIGRRKTGGKGFLPIV